MDKSKMGNGFKILLSETGETGKAYMEMVMKGSQASALDRKTRSWPTYPYWPLCA